MPRITRRTYATAAMVGALGYALVDVVLQFLPPHYSPISEAESNLAVGPYGWIMNLNFLGRAVLTVWAAIALSRSGPATSLRGVGLILMLLGGLCSAVLAFFPTDIAPPGGGLHAHSVVGTVHLVVATSGFVAALVGFALLTAWLRVSTELRPAFPVALACVVVTTAGLVSLGLTSAFAPNFLGLAERVCLVGTLAWVFTVCAFVRRLR